MEIATIVGITIGLTQALKLALPIGDRYVPLVSIVVGLGLAFLMAKDLPIDSVITLGIVAGLSASGLYDVGKKTVMNK
jgi:hydrogenase/urease accessory protein HupE